MRIPAGTPKRPKPVGVGVYRRDGDVYIVLESTRNLGWHFAKKLVISSPRITESGEEVDFDYEYAHGMVFRLVEADRMTAVELREFLIKYRKCVKCGKNIRAARTLQRAEEIGYMVGKTCARKLGLS